MVERVVVPLGGVRQFWLPSQEGPLIDKVLELRKICYKRAANGWRSYFTTAYALQLDEEFRGSSLNMADTGIDSVKAHVFEFDDPKDACVFRLYAKIDDD